MPAFAGEINRLTPVQTTSGRSMLCTTRDDVNLRGVTTVLREIETVGSRTSELACMYDRMMAWRRRQQLIFFGYSEAEILRLGNLSKLTDERMKELIHSNNLEAVEKSGEERNKMSMINKLFKRSRTRVKQYYVEGSGLIPVPIGRLNEVQKVIQEFHEQEAYRATLAGIARR